MKAIDQIVFVMGGAAIPSHLRQPRQPRLGGMPAPIAAVDFPEQFVRRARAGGMGARADDAHIALEHVEELRQFVDRSEEHTSELQSLMRISYAVFCLKKTQTRNQK